MVGIRIAHNRILSHDPHGINGAVNHCLSHFSGSQARLGWQRTSPQFFKPEPGLIIINTLIPRQKHRRTCHITGALDIILAAQRIQAGTGLPEITGHKRKIGQAFNIVSSRGMLGYTHCIIDSGPFSGSIDFCRLFDIRSRHPGDLFSPFRSTFSNCFGKGFKILGSFLYEILINEIIAYNNMAQPVNQRCIRTGLLGQPQPGLISKLDTTGISNNYLCIVFFGCLQHTQTDYRMCFSGVRTDNQHCVNICNTGNVVTHSTGTQHCDQTGHRRAVSVTGTMVYIISADLQAEKFLKDIVLFSGAAC